jgi:hypothetical protein
MVLTSFALKAAESEANAEHLRFMALAIDEWRKSVQEPGRDDPSPRVGVAPSWT